MQRVLLALCGAIALCASFALGFFVRAHGEPALFASWQQTFFDHGTLIAWWCTWFGYAYLLGPLCVVALIVAWRFAPWRTRAIVSVVSLLVAWQGADLMQRYFARPRPIDWVVKHETAFSYPSSHAAITAGFYLLWAAWIASSALPVRGRLLATSLLVALAAGICWSRIALGAHHVTDVLGGLLVGGGVAAILVALAPASAAVPSEGRA